MGKILLTILLLAIVAIVLFYGGLLITTYL